MNVLILYDVIYITLRHATSYDMTSLSIREIMEICRKCAWIVKYDFELSIDSQKWFTLSFQLNNVCVKKLLFMDCYYVTN